MSIFDEHIICDATNEAVDAQKHIERIATDAADRVMAIIDHQIKNKKYLWQPVSKLQISFQFQNVDSQGRKRGLQNYWIGYRISLDYNWEMVKQHMVDEIGLVINAHHLKYNDLKQIFIDA